MCFSSEEAEDILKAGHSPSETTEQHDAVFCVSSGSAGISSCVVSLFLLCDFTLTRLVVLYWVRQGRAVCQAVM